MLKIVSIILTILIATPVMAWERRGPQQFTITQPDGSMTTGQYVPDTGQVIMQTPGGPTVMQREPNNNWQISIQPSAPDANANGYDGGDD